MWTLGNAHQSWNASGFGPLLLGMREMRHNGLGRCQMFGGATQLWTRTTPSSLTRQTVGSSGISGQACGKIRYSYPKHPGVYHQFFISVASYSPNYTHKPNCGVCLQSFTSCTVCNLMLPAFANASEVLLFLTGNGHVNDRQDFFSGGIDQLMRNNDLKGYWIMAPKPLSATGVMRKNASRIAKQSFVQAFVSFCFFAFHLTLYFTLLNYNCFFP